ncbi:MAG: AAA family ATPase [Jatrophihabitantaceae bacterium]
MTAAYDLIVPALESHGCTTKPTGSNKCSAQCPAHEDSTPSLSITGIEGQTLIHCHAGCRTEDVMGALGLTMSDLFDEPKPGRIAGIPAHAVYRYDNGRQVIRSDAKEFRQAHTDAPAELYRLSKVRAAVAAGRPVFVVEGEKDVHALETLGVVATCSPMGAGKWSKIDPAPLYGGKVLVVADQDGPGRAHAAEVAASLAGRADVQIFKPKIGKDAADHVAAGYGIGDFIPDTSPRIHEGTEGTSIRDVGSSVPSVVSSRRTGDRQLSLTPASHITMRPVRWLWQTGDEDGAGRIPQGVVVIGAGRAGIGKSQFGAWLAAQITRGTLPGALHGAPAGVIYAAAEDSYEMTVVPRLGAAGADLERVYRINVQTTTTDTAGALTLPVDTAALGDLIRAHDVAMLVLDPLLSMIDASVNDYRAREVRAALEPLVAVADATRCTVYAIAHFTKAAGSDPLLLIGGSAGFGQLVRAALGFGRDEDTGECVLSTIKNNLGREDLPSLSYTIEPVTLDTDAGPSNVSRFVFGAESERHVRDLLREHSTDEDVDARDEAVQWLGKYLADGGGRAIASDALKAAARDGIAKSTLTRARRRAGVASSKDGFGGPWIWQLATTPDAPDAPQHSDRGATGGSGATGETRGLRADADSQSRQSRQAASVGLTGGNAAPCGHPLTSINTANGRCADCIMEALQRRAEVGA